MILKMLYDRILVRVIEGSNRTRGGLFIPDMAIDGTPWLKAEVLEVGHGRVSSTGNIIPLIVKRGDVICFFRSQASGEQMVVPLEDGTDGLVIREPNVCWIFEGLKPVSPVLNATGAAMEAS